jgi:hypothetical protein
MVWIPFIDKKAARFGPIPWMEERGRSRSCVLLRYAFLWRGINNQLRMMMALFFPAVGADEVYETATSEISFLEDILHPGHFDEILAIPVPYGYDHPSTFGHLIQQG